MDSRNRENNPNILQENVNNNEIINKKRKRLGSGEQDKSDSSSWEDQDSSDGEEKKLTIVTPCQKKKKKRVRKVRPKWDPESIPEDILDECGKLVEMNKSLDEKAKNFNMGTRDIKTLLRAIFKSDEIIAMLRNADLATGEKVPPAEPKMTRAMTKKVVESGDMVPWIINPATPVKEPDKEILSLVNDELPEDDEEDKDPEYNPEMETLDDDDDGSLFSLGTPSCSDSRSSLISTPLNNITPRSTKSTPDQFRRPFRAVGAASAIRNLSGNFEASPVVSNYSTRSKKPLRDLAIEDLEKAYIPFDVTPDMYESNVDNDDYALFLKELYAGTENEVTNVSAIEDEEDPEFIYCQNEADRQIKDPEELRNDKATKITKKEVAELMSELNEIANTAHKDAEARNRKIVKKKKNNYIGEQIFESIKNHSENALITEIASSSSVAPETSSISSEPAPHNPSSLLNPCQMSQLGEQMQQHIQLLTQMSLLSSNRSQWSFVRNQCDEMMSELLSCSLSSPAHPAGQSNLLTSMAVIKEWDSMGLDPSRVVKNKRHREFKKKLFSYEISDSLFKFMSDKNVFYYPVMLPTQALSAVPYKVVWTNGEDHLLAQAMMNTLPLVKRPGLTELSYTLQARHMMGKEATQIMARIRNLKHKEEFKGDLSNPVIKYIKTGEVEHTTLECNLVGNGSQTLFEMLRSHPDSTDFPNLWVKKLWEGKARGKLLPSKVSSSVSNSSVQVVTVPDKLVPLPGHTLVLVNSKGRQLASYTSLPGGAALCPVERPYPPGPPLPPPILCVDGSMSPPSGRSSTHGGENVPSSVSSPTSGSSTSTTTSLQVSGLGAGVKKLVRSPLKRFSGRLPPAKSPLKAASDRILKKYTKSPLKRNLLKHEQLMRRSHQHQHQEEGLSLALDDEREGGGEMEASSLCSPGPCSPCPLASQDLADSADTPTIARARKSRQEREAQLTLAMIQATEETTEERECRAERESREMWEEIRRVVDTSGSPEKGERLVDIINSAASLGTVGLYSSLNSLVAGEPAVQELLLDLLTPEEAASLGTDTYAAHHQRQSMKRFLLKLGAAYKHQPAYHARVLRELDSLCSHSNLTPEELKEAALRLFKHNQHLLEEFLLLVPGVEPPHSCLPSPETLDYPEDSDNSLGSEDLEGERITLPRSPQQTTKPNEIN